MFTGIIQGTGRIKGIEKGGRSGRITISTHLDLSGLKKGDSIAVDGTCLTITDLNVKVLNSPKVTHSRSNKSCQNYFMADLSHETLSLTTFRYKQRGMLVNLEKPLRINDAFGGHMVTGHIDGLGVVCRRCKVGDGEVFGISVSKELLKMIIKKGSVAVDGISLTVANVTEYGFEVSIIPFTLQQTTLPMKKVGEKVNIETDIIGKYVYKFFSSYKER